MTNLSRMRHVHFSDSPERRTDDSSCVEISYDELSPASLQESHWSWVRTPPGALEALVTQWLEWWSYDAGCPFSQIVLLSCIVILTDCRRGCLIGWSIENLR
eukprot:scaffold1062_cov130-Cylindrotheca_fusiformis.AAC.43